MTTKREVRIRALGELWMPRTQAAWEKTYTVGPRPFAVEIHDLHDAESRMFLDSGDLSRIIDYEIVYEITRSYTKPGVVGAVLHCRCVVARPWRDSDSEYAWDEMVWGDEQVA